MLFIKRGELADDPAVDECAEDRAPFYALKMPETEGKKAHRNAETKKMSLFRLIKKRKKLFFNYNMSDRPQE